jgi:hypothetical protein
MGMAHQWPAARIGGVMPAVPHTIIVAFTMPANATTANVMVTAPSSALTQKSCSSSPCTINVDARQGTHLVTIQYLNGSGSIVAQTDPFIQGVN